MNTATAPGGSRPLDQANQLEPQARLSMQPVNHIQHHHLLLLLILKADTHFTIPQRVEG